MPDSDDGTYRVWPDGTVQSTEDGQPHSWTSDDFMVITASSEEEALALSKKMNGKSMRTQNAAVAAIQFALETDDGMAFLRCHSTRVA